MKHRWQKSVALVLALALAMSLFSVPASAAGEQSVQGTGEKAVRTIMLYDCGSNLETMGGMATYNLMQILRANFSADDDVRFIVMTGGSEEWQTKSEYLYDPVTGTSPEKIDPTYNQIWEARGLDAANEAERGKLVLVDRDGVLGDGENAKRAQVLPEDLSVDEYGFTDFNLEKSGDYEWMSDPEVLKAFINYCAENYPAENYDLILWDHGGGPVGGFGSDDNDPGVYGGISFDELIDALYNNNVVKGGNNAAEDGGKFDFVDFDACLMNGVELDLAFAGCTHYYIASPETEPGYGQDYKGWLDALGKDPDMDTFELGKIIVDDFTAFYDKEEGDGSTQDGTLAVINMDELLSGSFVKDLTDLNRFLNDSYPSWRYYDELRSVSASLEYGDMSYIDLGNLVSQLGFAYKEANYSNLDGNGKIVDTNDYTDCAKRILDILNSQEIIYARGTEEIHTEAQYYRDADGTMKFGPQGTSGLYIYFPTTNRPEDVMIYYRRMSKAIEKMPEGKARDFLSDYQVTMLKYALVYLTGKAVTEMISQEEDKNLVEYGKGYEAVVNYWKSGDPDEVEFGLTKWDISMEELINALIEAEGQQSVEEWMEYISWDIASEAILRNHVSVTSAKEASGMAHTVRITDSVKQIVDSVNVNLIAELPAYEEYLQEYYSESVSFFSRFFPGLQIGTIKGSLVCNVDPEKDGYEALIKWLLDENSTWNLPAVEEKLYALQDADGTLHAVNAEMEKDGIYVRTGIPHPTVEMLDDGPRDTVEWDIVYLRFVDNKLQSVYFRQEAGGYREVPVSELVGELEVTPLVDIDFFYTFNFPISKNPFKLSAETAKDISLVYTDVGNISDIGDMNGDGKSLTPNVVIRNVYGYEMDISDLVAEADNSIKPAPRPSGGGGGGGGGLTTPSNPVSLPDPASGTTGGRVASSAASAKAGDKVTLTLTPDEGWQATGVTVTDKNGKDVPVIKNTDGTFSFTMPATAVTVTPAFEEIKAPAEPVAAPDTTEENDAGSTFADVSGDDWYHDAVQWATDKGIMNGVGNNRFAPDENTTRAMVVTMLWRLAGEPEAGASAFADVAGDAWYADAVAWAAEAGAVKGTSAETFDPDAPVTREQLAAILYRYAQAQGKGFTGAWAFPLSFTDAAEVSEYAYEPMCWMTMNGVINGMGDGTLAPKDNATRAQIAAMFMRFCAEIEK